MQPVRFLFVKGNLMPWNVEISHFKYKFFGRHFRPNFDKDFIVCGKIAQDKTNKMRPLKFKLYFRKLRYSRLKDFGALRYFELFQKLISQEERTKVHRLFFVWNFLLFHSVYSGVLQIAIKSILREMLAKNTLMDPLGVNLVGKRLGGGGSLFFEYCRPHQEPVPKFSAVYK